jgi:hypothetical protein
MIPTQETLLLPLKLHTYLLKNDSYPRNPVPTVETAHLPAEK